MAQYQYKYPRPIFAVDCVIFAYNGQELFVLLVKRDKGAFADHWALPGGFVHEGEDAFACAKRVLIEKTALENVFIEQLYTFSKPQRDPRDWVVSTAHYALLRQNHFEVKAGGNSSDIQWQRLKELPSLAFDHSEIIEMAMQRLKGKVSYQPIGFELMPPYFSLRNLQDLYETILQRPLDKRNFRKKILKMNILDKKENQEKKSKNDPDLYQFNQAKYEQLLEEGFDFEL